MGLRRVRPRLGTEFAAAFLASALPLRGLVHNAGALPPTRTTSAQGHELTMSLHVLGPVLMTELLLPALAADAGRVVFVTSGGMYTQDLPVDDPEFEHGEYSGTVAYARSKRGQVELLPVLAARWAASGLSVHATHPGWASTPGLDASLPRFAATLRPVLRSDVAGTDTTTWVVAREPAPPSGRLWHDRRDRPTSVLARTRPSDRRAGVVLAVGHRRLRARRLIPHPRRGRCDAREKSLDCGTTRHPERRPFTRAG